MLLLAIKCLRMLRKTQLPSFVALVFNWRLLWALPVLAAGKEVRPWLITEGKIMITDANNIYEFTYIITFVSLLSCDHHDLSPHGGWPYQLLTLILLEVIQVEEPI